MAPDSISEYANFNFFFLGGMPPDPPW